MALGARRTRMLISSIMKIYIMYIYCAFVCMRKLLQICAYLLSYVGIHAEIRVSHSINSEAPIKGDKILRCKIRLMRSYVWRKWTHIYDV